MALTIAQQNAGNNCQIILELWRRGKYTTERMLQRVYEIQSLYRVKIDVVGPVTNYDICVEGLDPAKIDRNQPLVTLN